MKLEVGMYVRTIKGKIWIINSQQAISGHRKDIINASNNIIDLIEVGDYVNGYKVITNKKEYIELNNADLNYDCIEYQRILKNKYSEIAINSIVTKEQFESMQYKVD